jgi:hypothetical protein
VQAVGSNLALCHQICQAGSIQACHDAYLNICALAQSQNALCLGWRRNVLPPGLANIAFIGQNATFQHVLTTALQVCHRQCMATLAIRGQGGLLGVQMNDS